MESRGCLAIFCIITTQLILFKEVVLCMMGQYDVDGECCYPCHAGYRINGTCSIMTGTTCVPCDPGTYTVHQSGLKECLQCNFCDSEFGFMTRRECSSISNTVCGCSPGHYCNEMKDDDCKLCLPHRVCAPGQYVKSQGTEGSNTICEDCQKGMFSPNGSLGHCLLWTNCTAQGLFEEKPGTDTRDALCSTHSNLQLRLIVMLSTVVIILIFISFICVVFVRRKKNLQRANDMEERVTCFCQLMD
ncbi:tumor necrosis factor receptor superfamily member 14-like isoform X1 [Petaurus breviceps papuanus]|uniref:tumor necrosis factor receptor superfamily member 14-like isoform X1 n=1 Tax=Petaurus breviceps papuanus TaxID=3040969 RepID=UPI0036DE0C21